ncbi:hypothetical protein ACFW04_002124 [Cataglyphis niger]
MSSKGVIITFPKGLSAPKALQVNELTHSALPRLNFTASILTDKARMDARKILQVSPRQKEIRSDDDFATFIKTEDGCARSKKRRLDHLTWEEKLQRKKLKNREAAQTSRDRKKAKLDELEETVKTLRERNEQLAQECTMLRSQNESLLSETKRLRRERDMRNETGDQQQQYCSACQARVGCAAPLPGMCITEDPLKKSDRSETMVGQASEDVEADRVRESINNVSYLPDTSDWHTGNRDTESTVPIKTEIEIKQESEPTPDLDTVYGTYDEATNSITIIYPGDENDGCVGIQECVQEVISTENVGSCDTGVVTHLTVPPLTTHLGYPVQFSPAYTDTMSPAMSDVHSDADSCGVSSTKPDYANLSDGGYESHDSPDPRLSNNVLADPWHESFTELFPMLA